MIRAVIFDFDGVILESAGIKTDAFRALFADQPPLLRDKILSYHGKNVGISRFVKFRHIYRAMLNEPLSRNKEIRLGRRFSELAFGRVLKAPFVPGALAYLRRHYKKLDFFVASGAPLGELKETVRARSIGRYFKELHGAPKEKAKIVEGILRRHRLKPAEVALVGDALSDERAARSSGVHFVPRAPAGGKTFSRRRFAIKDLRELAKTLKTLETKKSAKEKMA